MSTLYLLDSNILIDALRGYKPAQDWLSANARYCAISFLTHFELHLGADTPQRRENVNNLLVPFRCLGLNAVISASAAEICRGMRGSKGYHPIDALLSATAIAHNLTFVTRNIKHMSDKVSSLSPYT